MGDEREKFTDLIVKAVMSLCHGAKTKVRVKFELSKEFLHKLVYIKNICCQYLIL